MDVEAIARNDNSRAVEHVHPIRSVRNARRLGSSIQINRDEINLNMGLTLSHIAGTIISDELAQPNLSINR